MKRFIITITLLAALVSSVFAADWKTTIIGNVSISYDAECTPSFEDDEWDIGVDTYMMLTRFKYCYDVAIERYIPVNEDFEYKDLVMPILEKYGKIYIDVDDGLEAFYYVYAGPDHEIYQIIAGNR